MLSPTFYQTSILLSEFHPPISVSVCINRERTTMLMTRFGTHCVVLLVCLSLTYTSNVCFVCILLSLQIDHLEKSERTRTEEEEKKEQAVNPLVLRKCLFSPTLVLFKRSLSLDLASVRFPVFRPASWLRAHVCSCGGSSGAEVARTHLRALVSCSLNR